jgi:hypothetical protein
VTLLPCTPEVSSSNLGWANGYCDMFSHRQSFEENTKVVPPLVRGPFLSHSSQFIIHRPSYDSTPCLTTLSVVNHVPSNGRIKSNIFWDITPCSPLRVNRRFGGTYRLHLQGIKNKLSKKPAWEQVASLVAWCLPPALTFISCSAYFFDTEDGGDKLLRNVGWLSTDYTEFQKMVLFITTAAITSNHSY